MNRKDDLKVPRILMNTAQGLKQDPLIGKMKSVNEIFKLPLQLHGFPVAGNKTDTYGTFNFVKQLFKDVFVWHREDLKIQQRSRMNPVWILGQVWGFLQAGRIGGRRRSRCFLCSGGIPSNGQGL